MEAHIRKKLSFERYAKDFMGAAVSLKGYIPPAANNYCFPGFLPTYSAIRRRINEGSSKDRRRIIEG